jgi:hypothetical protein
MMAETGRRTVIVIKPGERSMLPQLEPGRRVVVDFSDDEPERGDILFFEQADYHVVHRFLGPAVLADGRPCLRTRGDLRPELDPPLERSRVLGRVVAMEDAEGAWWDLRGGGGRLYALALALHDLFWAAATVAATGVDRGLRLGGRLRKRVIGLDQRLLHATHRLFFRRCHVRLARPPAGGGSPGDEDRAW